MQMIERDVYVTKYVDRMDAFTAGATTAIVFAALHAVWAFVVAMGWAQSILDSLYIVHFINPGYTVMPFDWLNAAKLIGLNAVCGFVLGYSFSALYNILASRRS